MSNKFSDFPSGFDQGVLIKQIPLLSAFGGNVYWVDSGFTTPGPKKGTFNRPVASINEAMDLVTASNGDIIVMKPGHAETLTAATSAVMDVAGVALIGLGNGALTPTLTYTTAAEATLSITAASCLVNNVRFYSNFSTGITAGITVGGSADGLILSNLHFTEAANTKEWLIGISFAADCDDVIIENCRYYGIDGGTDSSFVTMAGGCDNSIIRNNYIHGDFSGACIVASAAASTEVQIVDNYMWNTDASAGLAIDFHASSTGWVINNKFFGGKDGTAGFTGAGFAYSGNVYTNAANANAISTPANDS